MTQCGSWSTIKVNKSKNHTFFSFGLSAIVLGKVYSNSLSNCNIEFFSTLMVLIKSEFGSQCMAW